MNQHQFIAVTPPPIQPAAGSTTLLTPSPSPGSMAQLVHSSPQMVIMPAGASPAGMKDSRWLTLEVCREFQRSKCSRSDLECKFAHPPPHVEVQNGRVVACFDSIKGKCQRKDPPCKYLHPPQHLREQLLQNGRNNLILKNLHLHAYPQSPYGNVVPVTGGATKTVAMSAVMPGQYSYLAHPSSSQAPPQAALRPPTLTPAVAAAIAPSHYDAAVSFAAAQKTHYPGLQTLSAIPAQAHGATYSPYLTPYASLALQSHADPNSIMSQQLPHSMIAAKAIRADKYETSADNTDTMTTHASMMDSFSYPTYFTQVCREFQRGSCSRATSECRYAHPSDHIVVDATDNHITVCMDFIKSKCTRDQCKYFHPPSHLQALVRAAHARNQAVISNNFTPNGPALTTSSAAMQHPMVIAKKRPRDPADDFLLQSSMPGFVPTYKRIAIGDISKGGYPVYQTSPMMSQLQPTSFMQLQQQPSYIPVSYTAYVYPPDPTLVTPSASSVFSPYHLRAALSPTMASASQSSTTTAPSGIISAVTAESTSMAVTTTSSSGDSIDSPSGLNLYMLTKGNNHSGATTSNIHGATRAPSIPTNAYYVEYFGNNKQLRDTLLVCQEFRSGLCTTPYCKLVHLSEDYVEVNNKNQVTVCRDFATRQTCRRAHCKYYHIPVELPPS